MKKLILALLIFCEAINTAHAQKEPIFQKFKGDLAFGFILPAGTGSRAGVSFSMEPKYTFFDKLTVGARLDFGLIGRASGYDANGDLENFELKALSSYLATTDFYFTNTKMRPFIGVGAGLFSFVTTSSETYTVSGDNTTTYNKFGGMFRAGFEVRHFRFGIEYNIVPSTTSIIVDNNLNFQIIPSKNNYLSIKVGGFIGGGRLSNKKAHKK